MGYYLALPNEMGFHTLEINIFISLEAENLLAFVYFKLFVIPKLCWKKALFVILESIPKRDFYLIHN